MKFSSKLFLLLLLFPCFVFSLDTIAKQAILYDFETKSVIFEKNADELMSPSSMSKLMTVYYVFDKIKKGEISINDKFKVSKKAWKKGGSRMFLNLNSFVTIEELLKGIIVQSGNDACITIAEGFAGSEKNFAFQLNELANKIGLNDSYFTNSTGWPDPDHLMTTRDILKIVVKTIEDFPELYKLYSEKEYTYNKIRQINRNPLLFSDNYTDGLKTGHTSLGGYGLAASSIRNGRRLILIINGLESNKNRKFESKRLMDAGFFQFKNFHFVEKEKVIDTIRVWNGKKKKLDVYSPTDISITIPSSLRKKLKVFIQYQSPVNAPIKKGQEIAKLLIRNNEKVTLNEFPLYSFQNIEEINFFSKIVFKFKYLVFGDSIYNN